MPLTFVCTQNCNCKFIETMTTLQISNKMKLKCNPKMLTYQPTTNGLTQLIQVAPIHHQSTKGALQMSDQMVIRGVKGLDLRHLTDHTVNHLVRRAACPK